MVVFAHPDDAEWGSSATVAKWIREGAAVEYVCVTDGSAGWNGPGMTRERLAGIRKEEQLAACESLGVQRCDFLGYVDGHVEVTAELRRDITRHVRRFRPDVLVVPDPSRLWDRERGYVNHTDHRTVGMACLAVINPDSPSRPMFPELLDEGYEPFEIPERVDARDGRRGGHGRGRQRDHRGKDRGLALPQEPDPRLAGGRVGQGPGQGPRRPPRDTSTQRPSGRSG